MVKQAGALVVEMLPARHGDAVLVSWGDVGDRHHLLIDGGPAAAYLEVRQRIREVAGVDGLDLMVLTHVDGDHIEGALLLANDADLNIDIREFWFNGPAQIAPFLGGAQGEMLAALIGARGINHNAAFGAAAVAAPEAGRPLFTHELAGGLVLTILGPDADGITRLRREWLGIMMDAGLKFDSIDEALAALRRRGSLNPTRTFLSGPPGPPDVVGLLQKRTPPDRSAANGSSIVVLVEYQGRRILLPGDATAGTLLSGARRIIDERGLQDLELDGFKLPHHGSSRNINRELLELLPADHYMFSSNGDRYGHPDDAAVARCLAHGRSGSALAFNYRNARTGRWDDPAVLARRGQRVDFPAPGRDGIRLTWSSCQD